MFYSETFISNKNTDSAPTSSPNPTQDSNDKCLLSASHMPQTHSIYSHPMSVPCKCNKSLELTHHLFLPSAPPGLSTRPSTLQASNTYKLRVCT